MNIIVGVYISFFKRLRRDAVSICVQMARWITAFTAFLLASAVASFGDGEASLEQLRSAMEPFRSMSFNWDLALVGKL